MTEPEEDIKMIVEAAKYSRLPENTFLIKNTPLNLDDRLIYVLIWSINGKQMLQMLLLTIDLST